MRGAPSCCVHLGWWAKPCQATIIMWSRVASVEHLKGETNLRHMSTPLLLERRELEVPQRDHAESTFPWSIADSDRCCPARSRRSERLHRRKCQQCVSTCQRRQPLVPSSALAESPPYGSRSRDGRHHSDKGCSCGSSLLNFRDLQALNTRCPKALSAAPRVQP